MKIHPEGQPIWPAPDQTPIPTDPFDELTHYIARLEASQRTPGTIEVSRGWWRYIVIAGALTVALGILNVVFGIHGLTHHDPSRSDAAPAAPVVQVAPDRMTDRELADALDAICAAHPGACTGQPVTVVNLTPTVVPWVCRQVANSTRRHQTPGRGRRRDGRSARWSCRRGGARGEQVDLRPAAREAGRGVHLR